MEADLSEILVRLRPGTAAQTFGLDGTPWVFAGGTRGLLSADSFRGAAQRLVTVGILDAAIDRDRIEALILLAEGLGVEPQGLTTRCKT